MITTIPAVQTFRPSSPDFSTKNYPASQPSQSKRFLSKLTIVTLPATANFGSQALQYAVSSKRSCKQHNNRTSVSFASSTFARSKSNVSQKVQMSRSAHCHHHFDQLPPAQIYKMARKVTQPNRIVDDVPPAYPSFLMLNNDILLPFIDRPSEIDALLALRRNAALFRLVGGVFTMDSFTGQKPSTSELLASPELWGFQDLKTWMLRVSREEVDDLQWCRTLQHAIQPRSAALWENLKAMLGVPPEATESAFFKSSEQQSSQRLSIIPIRSLTAKAEKKDQTKDRNDHLPHISFDNHITGLRISNILTSAGDPSEQKRSHSRYRSQTVSYSCKGSTPARHSPLNPFYHHPSVIDSSRENPYIEDKLLTSNKEPCLKVFRRQALAPRFPASFDKLTFQSLVA